MKYLSDSVPACPGNIKSIYDDFFVEEIPLYPFSGSGDHTLVQIEKTGLSTFEAVRRICVELSFPERDVGVAGLKDARGRTRQWLSFEHCPPERFAKLSIPKIQVLQTTRHGNKLKRGHLAGNRFTVVLRDVAPEHLPHAQATLAILAKRGVPNWYDTQRFGWRLDSARLGLCLIRKDMEGYFRTFLGEPSHELDSRSFEARKAYEDGNLAGALELLPRNANIERMALKAVMEHGPSDKALRCVQQKLKLFHVSAAQSLLFNRCLEQRFDELDRVWVGDLCEKQNGAKFTVEDTAAEQPRADAFEISATGPIFGAKMMQPKGREQEIELAVLEDAKLTLESFEIGKGLSQKGDRRPYRYRATDLEAAYDTDALTLKFALPKGCYATVLLKEITKDERVDLTFGDAD